PVDAASDCAAHLLDLLDDTCKRFAIACIGHALPSAFRRAMFDDAGDDLGLGPGAARDSEDAGKRKALDLDSHRAQHCHLEPTSEGLARAMQSFCGRAGFLLACSALRMLPMLFKA